MRKFSAGMILVMMMMVLVCSASHADIVYLTSEGDMGLVKLDGARSADLHGTQYTTSWSNPFLGSYWNGSSTRVILVDRTTDTTASGDTAYTFNPSDLTSPIETKRRVLAGVYSAQAMAGSDNGRAVFFASGSSVLEFSTDDFSLRRSYTYKPKSSDDITAEITGLMTGTNVIYALTQQDISRDIVLGFDGQLRDDVSTFEKKPLAYETEAISWLSGSRVAAGHEYGVDVWFDSRGFLPALSTDAPVKAVCEDGGTGFYFIEQYESDDVYTTTLKHYSSGKVSTLFTNTIGQTCQLVRDKDNWIIGVIAGDTILVYRMDDDVLLGEYDSILLGGLPLQIAVSNVSGDKGKNNSGCSLSGMGMMLFLAGVCVIHKRH